MAAEKMKKSKFAEETEKIKMEQHALKMLGEVRETSTRAQAKMRVEYENHRKYREQGNFKRANQALRTFRFVYRMNELATRFIEVLETVQTVEDLFRMLEGTSETFSQLMSFNSDKVTKSVKKNLKQFKARLAKYEAQTDRLLEYIETIFDERPSFFKRFINKLTGKKPRSDSDIYNDTMAEVGVYITSFEAANGLGSAQAPEVRVADDGSTPPPID